MARTRDDGPVTEPEALAWWAGWCAREGHDPTTADARALADAVLDARNAGWADAELVVLVEAVGEVTGSWRTSGWATLRLGIHA